VLDHDHKWEAGSFESLKIYGSLDFDQIANENTHLTHRKLQAMDDINKTRYSLIQRLNDPSDISAWNEFQLFYRDMINAWTSRKGCTFGQRDDVFQETMIALMKSVDKFKADTNVGYFRSYLKTIVNRRIVDSFRREKKYVSLLPNSNENGVREVPDESSVGEHDMDILWMKSVLRQALRSTYAKLDPQTYRSFIMHVIEGKTVSSVAKTLDIPNQKNVYEHKRRTLGIIKDEFIRLMNDMNDDDLCLSFCDSKHLEKAIKDIIEENGDCQDTIGQPTVADQLLLKQINFAMDKIRRCRLPDPSGTYLISFSKNGVEPTLLENHMTFGRIDICDFVLDGHGISRVHASISESGSDWLLRDEDSSNGVYLNGTKIDREIFLKDGDILQFTAEHQFVLCRQDK
jgi:RNA polymerase sigma factor (sigma-70 family)